MKQKKKGKIRFVIYIAGERTFFFIYDVIVKQKIKKRPANHYSRRSRRSLSLTAAASGPGLKGLGWCEATDMCLIQGSCCRILLQDPVELAGFCWAVTGTDSRDMARDTQQMHSHVTAQASHSLRTLSAWLTLDSLDTDSQDSDRLAVWCALRWKLLL